MGKTIRSFNASENVNDLINESKVKKGDLSTWINEKIEKGVLYDNQDKPKKTKLLENVGIII